MPADMSFREPQVDMSFREPQDGGIPAFVVVSYDRIQVITRDKTAVPIFESTCVLNDVFFQARRSRRMPYDNGRVGGYSRFGSGRVETRTIYKDPRSA